MSQQSTTASFNNIREMSPQDNSAGDSHTTADDENGCSSHLEIGKVNRPFEVEGKDLSVQIAEKVSEETADGLYIDLSVPVSKVRPCALEPNLDMRTEEYLTFGPKVQPATEPLFDSIVNEVLCRGDSFSTIGSHKGHHHSSSARNIAPPASGDHSIEDCPTSYNLCFTTEKALNSLDRGPGSSNVGGPSCREAPENTNGAPSRTFKLQLSEINWETLDQGIGPKYPSENAQLEERFTQARKLGSVAGRHTTPESYSRILHAPVPVSKIRPAFHSETASNLQHYGHSSISKVGPSVECLRQSSQNGRSYFMTDSDDRSQDKDKQTQAPGSHGSSCHTQTATSVFDYKRTTQWLKDVLRHPPTYSPKYTRRPGQNTQKCNTLPELKSVRCSTDSSKSLGRFPVPPENQLSRIDRIGFKRAVSDLENLLNEALAIAMQVVDHPSATGEKDAYKQQSISGRSQYQGSGNRIAKGNGSRTTFASPSVDGSGGDLGPAVAEYETVKGHTGRSHTAQLHSGPHEFLKTHTSERAINQENVQGLGQRVALRIPRRKSSKKLNTVFAGQLKNGAQVISQAIQNPETNQVKGFTADLEKPSEGTRPDNRTTKPDHAHTNHPPHRQPAAGEDILPERDIAGRPLHTEHGISLRRRSHVSLRGAQGFSLAKSHRRQPIARD
ncbi:hypothetical protein MAA_11121 [Metarhizium robertsii ARSEF 23]|uniref:Uncharacterized protein n=1 Tax=Metarhizium robertsii (strain ARSEF 23 / ATCC MYA-3075) TaxID=655844 RepID=A0A0B2XHC2_METRA|nr:uncharacterized protein MAA_11121 [Metarhizium robertsii ARSEF 23]KHO11306.1 hypothetical protein MAA_11121 [Metarhizium robertsii ARSEF 23]